jgi:hypothetical protein
MLDNVPKIFCQKNSDAVAKREAVAHLVAKYEMSERRACCVIQADRKTVRYRSRRPRDEELRDRLKGLAGEQRRFGYPRLHVLLRAEGHAGRSTSSTTSSVMGGARAFST